MARIRLTSKRQATLPVALCDELRVGPGDELLLERRALDGETLWVLRPARADLAWFGSLRRWAKGKSHDPRRIRKSIERGWADDPRD